MLKGKVGAIHDIKALTLKDCFSQGFLLDIQGWVASQLDAEKVESSTCEPKLSRMILQLSLSRMIDVTQVSSELTWK